LQKRQVSDTINGMKRKSFSDEIRAAVDACGLSRYRLCMTIGLDQGALSKFMSGKAGLSVAYLDKLADVLDLHVVARRKGRK
jgi:transcriptional regulator with XRE-family HTH domain